MKRLYILAGANGSGKSTISKVLLPSEGIVYVNPDDIAKELNPTDPVSARIEAGRVTLGKINTLLESGDSFAVESTLSGNAYIKMLEQAKVAGYETIIAYVFVDSPEVCIARIAARVKNGGHYVPDEDVRRRYQRSKEYPSLCATGGSLDAVLQRGNRRYSCGPWEWRNQCGLERTL